MFAAIQNNRLVYCVENETLCEALARGFETIAELREWEAALPADAWGQPIRPRAPFEIRRLEGAVLEQYRALADAGYRPGEIILAEPDVANSLTESLADVPADSSDAAQFAETTDASEISESSAALLPPPTTPEPPPLLRADDSALERRKSRAEWDEIRARRNALLAESDKYMLPDYPVDDENRAAYRKYREKLRNITNRVDSPAAVKWPEPPESPEAKKQSRGAKKKSRGSVA